MIAYHLLCHGNFEQVALQINALYSPDDVFLIDIDDGQNPDLTPIDRFASMSNVHLVRDSNIGWGGAGTLRKTLRGAFHLLELDSQWRYYVVLSGQDLPLKCNEQIKDQLGEGDRQEKNFLCWAEAPEIAEKSVPRINSLDRISLWGDRGHTRVYVKPGVVNPQADFAARWLVDVVEIGEKGEVYIGRCDEFLLSHRQRFFRQYSFHYGANWFNLHRSLIEYMAEDPFARELYSVLKGTFIPDESFFQTYIMNSELRHTASWDNSRLILRPGPKPRVKVFTMDDFPRLCSGSELYGRKFDIAQDSEVVHQILTQCASPT